MSQIHHTAVKNGRRLKGYSVIFFILICLFLFANITVFADNEPSSEQRTEQVTENITELVTESITEPVTELITGQATELISEPSTATTHKLAINDLLLVIIVLLIIIFLVLFIKILF